MRLSADHEPILTRMREVMAENFGDHLAPRSELAIIEGKRRTVEETFHMSDAIRRFVRDDMGNAATTDEILTKLREDFGFAPEHETLPPTLLKNAGLTQVAGLYMVREAPPLH